MTNIDKAAALLHQRSKGLLGVDSDAARRACQEHAQALADAGLLAPDLPEPSNIIEEDGEKRICWYPPGCDIELVPGEMIVTYEHQAGHEIEHAHQIGLALLAATNHAEEEA